MDKNENFEVNWLNLITHNEFIQYLGLDLIKEISLISKLAREKIKSQLFKNIGLSTDNYDFKFNDNIFIEYIRYCINVRSNFGDPDGVNHNIANNSVESSLNDFTCSLKELKNFVKSFNLEDVDRSGFYLFPIVNNFNNLVSLKLDFCAIPLAEFYKLGESLVNLNNIKLSLVTFIKLNNDDIKSDDIKFPRNLKSLNIYHCTVICRKLVPNPVKFLLSDISRIATNDYTLPNVSVPCLKKLTFYGNDAKNAGIKSFLEANPNLDYLKIERFTLSIIIKLNSLYSLEFDLMKSFNTKYKIPILERVKKLKITSVRSEYFENINKLLSFCSNLQELHFVIDQFEQSQPLINIFLAPVLSKLNQLKTFNLMFKTDEDENLDITKFSNIESIIIKAERYTIFNLNFSRCKSLKKVELSSFNTELNTQEFKDKFNSYENWEFKFSVNAIRGYKLSQ